ncbi:10020_t:CDS:2 [Acaulospora morrowiae]|uniref:10020_t:CDS:1 n=1 Tax=Acaulospora morrowiae TaxID=94023 RepID=A0A9N9BCU4_9GLOM|nr:10020_t:CDS:2 [Acaulospora morrowiae]
MTDTNISKTDFKNVCQALGIATDGVKADLVQRIRRYLKGKSRADSCDTEGNGREEDEDTNTVVYDNYSDTSEIGNLNQQARTLKNQLEKEQLTTVENNGDESKLNLANNRKCPLSNDKETESKENKLLTEFKRLKNAMLTFNNRLNTVTAQVRDTKQKVEVNETWQKHKFEKSYDQHEYNALHKIGKELDLAMEL